MGFGQGLQRVAGALALALMAAPASAAAVSYTAATSILEEPGLGSLSKGGPDRYIASNALGATDGKFYSLGLGGTATLEFGRSFGGTSEIRITEVTFGSLPHIATYGEAVDVFALNGGAESFVGRLTNFAAYTGVVLTYTGPFDALRFVDVTQSAFVASPSFDGFDIDSVEIGSIVPVPLPASGLLLAALVMWGTTRRRV